MKQSNKSEPNHSQDKVIIMSSKSKDSGQPNLRGRINEEVEIEKEKANKSADLKIEYKAKSMSQRINNVFSHHNKPVDQDDRNPKFRS